MSHVKYEVQDTPLSLETKYLCAILEDNVWIEDAAYLSRDEVLDRYKDYTLIPVDGTDAQDWIE